MKYLTILIALVFVSNSPAQSIVDRLAALEQQAARMERIEAKVDALAKRLDDLTSVKTACPCGGACSCPLGVCPACPAAKAAKPCTTCTADRCTSSVCRASDCEKGDCVLPAAIRPTGYHVEEWQGRLWLIPDGKTIDRRVAPAYYAPAPFAACGPRG